MRAAFFKLPGQVEVRDIPKPQLEEGQVMVRVLACGICGSDVAMFKMGNADWHRRGHEYAGEVVAIGKGVEGLSEGDIVAGIGSLPCGECPACKRGEPRNCFYPRWFGGDAFSEYLCKPAEFFFPIPGLSPEEGALIEPLTVAIDLVIDGDVRLGSKVLLIGAGPIGLMALRLCKEAGAKVYVSHPSTSTSRLKLAEEWGADLILYPDKEDIVSRMRRLEPQGVDCALVTITPSVGIPQAAQVCAVGGRIAFIGMEWKPQASLTMNIDDFHFRKLHLIGSNHNPCSRLYPHAVDLLRSKVIDARKLISHRFPLERIGDAFRLMVERRSEVRKVLIV